MMAVDSNMYGDNGSPFNDYILQIAEIENGLHTMLEKVKGDSQMTKDISSFFKKRAFLEESYGRDMVKIAQATAEAFDKTYPKSGTLGAAWISMLKVHENIGAQRMKFATAISDAAEDLLLLSKHIEKDRKKVKDQGLQFEKIVTDADLQLEKSKHKFESTNDEWSRAVTQRDQEPIQPTKKNLFRSSKTPHQIVNDCRLKVDNANAQYRLQQKKANQSHAEYYESHLPSVLRDLKAVDDECNVALRYQLASYAYTFEQAIADDGIALDNEQGQGLRGLITKIDRDADWSEFVRLCVDRGKRIQRIDYTQQEYTGSPVYNAGNNRVFGVSLDQLAEVSPEVVPDILRICTGVVEEYGLRSTGLYRVPGTNSRVQKIKQKFELGDPNPISEEDLADINNITGVIKLWLRELPDALLPSASYYQFIEAAKIQNPHDRVIELHTIINELSDAHYATLKFFMRHLYQVQSLQLHNKMTSANLALIFGLTLMSNESGNQSQSILENQPYAESQLQVIVVQTILDNYQEIFEDD
ncbi:RhoGAP-domain-containing protein [Backusella circina FSU 941]|nr:RhoGAP-domain-containing protein [Backusella circina FSU 941]